MIKLTSPSSNGEAVLLSEITWFEWLPEELIRSISGLSSPLLETKMLHQKSVWDLLRYIISIAHGYFLRIKKKDNILAHISVLYWHFCISWHIWHYVKQLANIEQFIWANVRNIKNTCSFRSILFQGSKLGACFVCYLCLCFSTLCAAVWWTSCVLSTTPTVFLSA